MAIVWFYLLCDMFSYDMISGFQVGTPTETVQEDLPTHVIKLLKRWMLSFAALCVRAGERGFCIQSDSCNEPQF